MSVVGLLAGAALAAEVERRAGTALGVEVLRGASGQSTGLPFYGMEIGFGGRFAETWRAGVTLQAALVGRRGVGAYGVWQPTGSGATGGMIELRALAVATEIGCEGPGCPRRMDLEVVPARGALVELRPGWRYVAPSLGLGLSAGLSGEVARLWAEVPAGSGPYAGGLLGVWVGVDL